MRVIHFADLHIGVETYGRPLPERGWSSRMQDFLDAFDHLVAYAMEEGVDAVIFAGDAYKAREPSQTHQREFARRVRQLSDAGIATFLLVGNHDLPNAEGRAHALEIFRTLDVPNVVVGDHAWFRANGRVPRVLQTRSGPLQVAYLPWPQVGQWLAANPEFASAPIVQQMDEIEREMTALIQDQAYALDPDVPAVLACHVSVNDFLVNTNPGSERWMTVGTAPTLLKSNLASEAFDYVALGHHHNNMKLDLSTPTWYAGSMQAVDFGERGQPKGFMVVDIDTSKRPGSRVGGSGLPRLEQVPARRFVQVDVHPKDPDPTPEVCAAIEREGPAGAIVKVEVDLSREQLRNLRIPEIRRLLESAHYVAGIHPILPNEDRGPVPPGESQPDASSPLETLELYFRTREMEEKRRAQLLVAARHLMEAEGVPVA